MDKPIDRRSALSTGASALFAAAATTLPARMAAAEPAGPGPSAAIDPAGLIESAPSFDALFPATRYFEIDSKIANARFAAWVTLPAQYSADNSTSYPIIYQMDGNLFFPTTAPFHQAGQGDALSPQLPFILVSVGYSKPESHAWAWLRMRDLTPPGEAVPEIIRQTVEPAVKAGRLSQDEGRRYLAMFASQAADKFLAFLEQELHPQLAKTFRIDASNIGLWGYSYGGLFTTYVAIKQSALFKCIGAGSPGIVEKDSQIFQLYRQAVASKQDYSGRRLHVTLCVRELTQPGIYQWVTARGTSELLAQTSLNPLPNLQVSSELIALETHLTGALPAWFSFLRACFGRKP